MSHLARGSRCSRRFTPFQISDSTVPFKANAARRHRIPKQRHRVTDWAEYDAALRQRGSLTVWFSEEAIAAWRAEPRRTRGGQPHYSALAIRTALTLRAVFRLALRQTEGLIGSILQLLGLDLAVPDHSTLAGAPRPSRCQDQSRVRRCICWWTAQACACVDRVSGCQKHGPRAAALPKAALGVVAATGQKLPSALPPLSNDTPSRAPARSDLNPACVSHR